MKKVPNAKRPFNATAPEVESLRNGIMVDEA